jgi:peptidoglycan hydrolase-like protein with peptidoglycan-binding domain
MNRITLCFVAAAMTTGVLCTSAGAAARSLPDHHLPACPAYRLNDQYPIRHCDKGDDVKTIQAALRTAGYPVTIDGYFGPHTHHAVRAFQDDNELHVDGLVGPQTWRALNARLHMTGTDSDGSGLIDPDESSYSPSDAPPAWRHCTRYVAASAYPLNRCDKGPAVRVAQLFLAELYAPLTIDGYFGPDTEAAVQNYQREFGHTVDGLVGPETWRALTAGFTCGSDSDGSGVIDPDEVALPQPHTHMANFFDACTTR